MTPIRPGRIPSYAEFQGFRLPRDFSEEGFRTGLRYEARPDDIFISAYPKCGTTWTQHVVWLIVHDGEPLGPDRRIDVEMPHLEEAGAVVVASRPSPRLIKTHLPYSMTPHHPEARYVYIARNPFDCVVSFFHHTRGFVRHYDFADGTFDDFFECFLAGEVDFGDYFDSVLSWYDRRDDDHVLFLTFEGMKRDPRAGAVAIAEFLGSRGRSALRDPTVMDRVLRHSSFERMSEDQARWSSARPDGFPPFVRKGIVGDWRSTMSREQADRLARELAERMRGTDLPERWADAIPSFRQGP